MTLITDFTTPPEPGNVYHCDALTLLRALPDNSVDAVITDPPYGNNNGVGDLAAARARDKVKGGRQHGEITPIINDDYDSWEQLILALLPEINRVLKPVSVSCLFAGGGGGVRTHFARMVLWLEKYHSFFHAVVWDKSARGYGLGWRYRRNYEFVMISHKQGGKLAWNPARKAAPNVVYFTPTNNEYHVTQKPVEMIEWLILNHTSGNALILDPFAGSGTTLVAARNLNRRYIGCDITPEYVEIARERLAMPFTLNMFEMLGK